MNYRLVKCLSLFFLMAVSQLTAWGQKTRKFVFDFQKKVEYVEKEADKDPESFPDNVKELEDYCSKLTNPVEKSLVHAMLASSYRGMQTSNVTKNDLDIRNDYNRKSDWHLSRVLDDCEALADAKAKDYGWMVSSGSDDELYEDDLLSIMASFVANKVRRTDDGVGESKKRAIAYQKAYQLYRQRGNKNAYALFKHKWIDNNLYISKANGGWSAAQVRDSLYALLLEVQHSEVGADIALAYVDRLDKDDDRILFLKWAEANLGKSKRMSALQQRLSVLMRPKATLNRRILRAGHPMSMSCEFWSCDKAVLTIRRFAGEDPIREGDVDKSDYSGVSSSYARPRLTGEVVQRKEIAIDMDSANAGRLQRGLPLSGSGTTSIQLLPGKYVAILASGGDNMASSFHVSSMCLFSSYRNDSLCRLFVLDGETGRPLEGVKVQCRKSLPAIGKRAAGWENRDVDFTLITDANGGVDIPMRYYARAVAANEDDYTDYKSCVVYANRDWYAEDSLHYKLYTDRSIYRPGQKIWGNRLAYSMDGDETSVVEGRSAYVRILSEGNLLDSIPLLTNSFGTASFSYVLPKDCPVGSVDFYLASAETKETKWLSSVSVEEYKRPTFEVKLDGATSGAFGQTLDIKGQAMMFAGIPVQGAQVSYEVFCAQRYVWRWRDDWQYVDDGTLVSDDEGRFVIPLELADGHKPQDVSAMRFRVVASVTDANGETREAEWIVNVGKMGGVLMSDTKPFTDKREIEVYALDANGKRFTAHGSYSLKAGEKVCAEGVFSTDAKISLPEDVMSGVRYSLEVQAVDSLGSQMKETFSFVYVDYSMPVSMVASMDKKPKIRKKEWPAMEDIFVSASDKATYEVGGYVDMLLSTRETDAYVMLHVYNVDGLIDSCAFVTDGTMKCLRMPYRKEWGEGITVVASYLRNGNLFSGTMRCLLAKPDKRLKLEWSTFRNRLEPGQKEQWRLTVTDQKGRRVSGAEMMAVLYDASLDRIMPHRWMLSLPFLRRTLNGLRYSNNGVAFFPYMSVEGQLAGSRTYDRSYGSFRGFIHDQFRGTAMPVMMKASRASGNGAVLMEVAMGTQKARTEDEAVYELAMDEGAASPASSMIAPRSDFAETAFFLPHLVSDSHGQVDIAFTLPESLTEWRFMGLVQTAAMDYDTITASAHAQKTVMIRPNMPRFLRHGDKASISSAVINQGETNLQTMVRMRLIDAATGLEVLAEEKMVDVAAGKTVGVSFDFDVDKEWADLDCEIIASSGNVGDGERNALPILPAKQVLTEAVPFFIQGDGDKPASAVVDLTPLFNSNSPTADSRSMTVEYMDSPAWMCVEALRSVKNPSSDNSISWASALTANASLLSLLGDFPLMEKYENADSLRERVGEALRKLSSLQKADGGWSWFDGMQSNSYVSLSVCECLAQMPSLDDKTSSMLHRGMAYIDSLELRDYTLARKHGRSLFLSNEKLRYLDLVMKVNALMPDSYSASKDILSMRNYYARLLEKHTDDLTVFGLARTACILRDNGRVKVADRLVDKLRDYTVARPGQGRFYATDAAYYSWMDYRIPTQIAAMRALMQADKSDPYLNDMLLWIISQKQVQRWDNPMTAVNVARLLLDIDSSHTLRPAQRPQIYFDGVALDSMRTATMATRRAKYEGRNPLLQLEGCVLADVPSSLLSSDAKSLTVTKTGAGISWGAVHTSFVEDMANIAQHSSGELNVQRKLYVQRGGVGSWEACDDSTSLRVGDKLRVRHIIHSDRDMDFVCLKANHPANLEPVNQLSGYRFLGGRGGYLSIRDSRFELFFDTFTRGSSSVDVEYNIVRARVYGFGAASVECTYAPQFGGHTAGLSIESVR